MQNKRNQFLTKLALSGLGLGLMAYAASRTLEFVQSTMPADKQFMGYLFLLATGIGALIWLAVFLNHAEGAKQRALSFAMGLIDLAGEGVLVYADTMRTSSANGLLTMSQSDMQTFILASVGAIVLNALAWYMFKLWDPTAERSSQARDLVDEVTEAAIKKLNSPEAKAQMIAELSPTLQGAIMAEVTAAIQQMASQHLSSNVIDARAYSLTTPATAPRIAQVPATPGGLWMQSAKDKTTGERKRVFCLSCLAEGKQWFGGELCEHLQQERETVLKNPVIENFNTGADNKNPTNGERHE